MQDRWQSRFSKQDLARRFWRGSLLAFALLVAGHALIGCGNRETRIDWGGKPIVASQYGLWGPSVVDVGNTVDRQKFADYCTGRGAKTAQCLQYGHGRTPSDNPEAPYNRHGGRSVHSGCQSVNTVRGWYNDCTY